ncbi:MAG: hypothetical protein K5894_14195 [Lachnospiraceae bacterium]|nr:hypothetical protein [Lachnospiraceae bacterium]
MKYIMIAVMTAFTICMVTGCTEKAEISQQSVKESTTESIQEDMEESTEYVSVAAVEETADEGIATAETESAEETEEDEEINKFRRIKFTVSTDRADIKFTNKIDKDAEEAFRAFLAGERTARYKNSELFINNLYNMHIGQMYYEEDEDDDYAYMEHDYPYSNDFKYSATKKDDKSVLFLEIGMLMAGTNFYQILFEDDRLTIIGESGEGLYDSISVYDNNIVENTHMMQSSSMMAVHDIVNSINEPPYLVIEYMEHKVDDLNEKTGSESFYEYNGKTPPLMEIVEYEDRHYPRMDRIVYPDAVEGFDNYEDALAFMEKKVREIIGSDYDDFDGAWFGESGIGRDGYIEFRKLED